MADTDKGKLINFVSKINKNVKKIADRNGYDMETKRDYLGSFSLCGDEIPKDLEAEYNEEYEMTLKVRVSDVGDNWGIKKEKRIDLQVKKILSIKDLDTEDDE